MYKKVEKEKRKDRYREERKIDDSASGYYPSIVLVPTSFDDWPLAVLNLMKKIAVEREKSDDTGISMGESITVYRSNDVEVRRSTEKRISVTT